MKRDKRASYSTWNGQKPFTHTSFSVSAPREDGMLGEPGKDGKLKNTLSIKGTAET
jgi:hypothetical protein